MITAALCLALAFAIGSIPVPYFAGRLRGIDLLERARVFSKQKAMALREE